jgi:hypothetical protein
MIHQEYFNIWLNPSEDRRYFILHYSNKVGVFDALHRKVYSLLSDTSPLIEFGDKKYVVRLSPRWIDGNQIEIRAYIDSENMLLGCWQVAGEH